MKTELSFIDVIELKFEGPLKAINGSKEEEDAFGVAGGSCFDFHKFNWDIFIVGTEEGKIHKCLKSYNSQYILTFEGHLMGVYALRYNPFKANIFISASADWTVKIWDQDTTNPLLVFDLNSSVGDIAWSPYSSTIFAAVTADGKVYVFDLNESKYEPVCEQQITKKSKLTRVSFNQKQPVLLVGDDKGQIMSFKLSPNLRKQGKEKEETQEERFDKVMNTGKVDKE